MLRAQQQQCMYVCDYALHTMYAEGGACHGAHNGRVGLVDNLVVLVDSNALPSNTRTSSGWATNMVVILEDGNLRLQMTFVD